MAARVWTFWPCGCASFPTGYWIMCEGCMRVDLNGKFCLIPGLFHPPS